MEGRVGAAVAGTTSPEATDAGDEFQQACF